MHRRQSWAAPVAAFMISAALLSGCTSDNPGDDATTVAPPPTGAAPSPSPEPSPTEEVTEEPPPSAADAAAVDAEATYRQWVDYEAEALQDPAPISGEDEEADAAFDQLVSDIRTLALDQAEGELVAAVGQYDQFGWRQVGRNTVEDVRVMEVDVEPSNGSPHVTLSACLVPDADFGLVDSTGSAITVDESELASEAVRVRVERRDLESGPAWLVRSAVPDQERSC